MLRAEPREESEKVGERRARLEVRAEPGAEAAPRAEAETEADGTPALNLPL